MKSLVIITGMILLSYQVDHLLTFDNSKLPDTPKISLGNAFLAADDSSISTENLRSARHITKKMNLRSLKKISTSASKQKTVKSRHAGKTFRLSKARKLNSINGAFHRSIKQSGNYSRFGTVKFKLNKHAAVETEQFNVILQFADKLIFDTSLKISIAGFTDNKGNVTYNDNLSLQRVENIKKYLMDLGVNEAQIIISANGAADPTADNATEEGRAENRRVEMALIAI